MKEINPYIMKISIGNYVSGKREYYLFLFFPLSTIKNLDIINKINIRKLRKVEGRSAEDLGT